MCDIMEYTVLDLVYVEGILMINQKDFLQFKGKWRNYQERVLNRTDIYLEDGRIHIVAAPGSGKTTLGIELIARVGRPTLVLVPSIVIREQWEQRIVNAFLMEGLDVKNYVSQDLKHPSQITISTYQALHSAMTKYTGKLTDKEVDEEENGTIVSEQVSEEVDYKGFDLIATLKEAGVGTLCLDECHHLRSEWWKALEDLKKQLPSDFKTIALTATPPYDSTEAMWNRYIDMCGEIDEEITIPELVKEGSLCPHQDYVYFNYPTKQEEKSIAVFEEKAKNLINELLQDQQLQSSVLGHPFILGMESDDTVLDNPAYLASLLIYLNQTNRTFPKRYLKLLGVKKLPQMEQKWMEILLQQLLYDDAERFSCDQAYKEQLLQRLKQDGLLERRKVVLTNSTEIEKLLLKSKGKAESIVKIAESEYESLGRELRMVILTDYIRKEYMKNIGAENSAEVPMLGVLPFFELVRRHFSIAKESPRMGVLCGSVVIIPAEAREELIRLIGDDGRVSFSSVGQLSENDYVQVVISGNQHILTSVVTEIFRQGYIHILVGTKSLLGEGWDSPCINSLILASFVGSFMLSNQMRGRAIRTMKDNPDKTSNIWHLVCLKPTKFAQTDVMSEDYCLLERRMEHFLGLHYTENTIESGMNRLSIIKPPFHKINIEAINRKMLEMSRCRVDLRKRWMEALEIHNQPEIIEESEVPDRLVTVAVLYEAFADLLFSIALAVAANFLGEYDDADLMVELVVLCIIIALSELFFAVPKLFMAFSPYKRLKSMGEGIQKAMKEQGLLEDTRCKVVVEHATPTLHSVYLEGGTSRDKSLFAKCVIEFFGQIDNQRYLLVRKYFRNEKNAYYAVPEIFAKNKESANAFSKCMKRYLGKYDLIYTRNEEGRKLLLKGRVHAFANRDDRLINHKKVKGALE